MGLGGYLAARSDADHYAHEQAREKDEITSVPNTEAREDREIFQTYGLTFEESANVVESLRRPKDWVKFMIHFELGLEPDSMMTMIFSYPGQRTMKDDAVERRLSSLKEIWQ